MGGRHSTTVGRPHRAQIFVALYSYKGRTENEMSFKKGDLLHVIGNDNSNWWQAKHADTGQAGWIPSNYVAPMQSIDKEPWYHGRIARTEAEFLLSNGIDGSFLVRESQSSPGEYSISMRYDGKVLHYRVSKSAAGVFVAQDKVFPSLSDLITYHGQHSDGLVHCLKHAVKRQQGEVLSKVADDQWEVDRATIRMGRKLGSGQYGDVYEAVWTTCMQRVAVKTLKEEAMDVDDFLKEANVMKRLKHKNLVQLIGLCTRDTPMFIITEFMVNGNLLDYLRDEDRQKEIGPTAMMHIASQVAEGMAYLEKNKFIHRDLAARNCLVGDNLTVKLADFGLARFLTQDDPYTAKAGSKFPIKWTAPESINYNRFTIKSDVWAFGICLWEIATLGATPYPGMDLYIVLEKLEHGYRMPRPQGCPPEVYQLMRDCWQQDPRQRPAFKQIVARLQSMYADGTNIEEEVDKTLTLDTRGALLKLDPSPSPPSRSPRQQRRQTSAATTAAAARTPAPAQSPPAPSSASSSSPPASSSTRHRAATSAGPQRRLTRTRAVDDARTSSLISHVISPEDRRRAVEMVKALFKLVHRILRPESGVDVYEEADKVLSRAGQFIDFVSVFARDDKNGSLAQSLAELEEHVLHLNHLKQHHSNVPELQHAAQKLARKTKAVCDHVKPTAESDT